MLGTVCGLSLSCLVCEPTVSCVDLCSFLIAAAEDCTAIQPFGVDGRAGPAAAAWVRAATNAHAAVSLLCIYTPGPYALERLCWVQGAGGLPGKRTLRKVFVGAVAPPRHWRLRAGMDLPAVPNGARGARSVYQQTLASIYGWVSPFLGVSSRPLRTLPRPSRAISTNTSGCGMNTLSQSADGESHTVPTAVRPCTA